MRAIKINYRITIRNHELEKYLYEISQFPILNPEEEADLLQNVVKGGKEERKAKEKLITSNLRFVVSVAKQYQSRGVPLCDLINEGNIGLINAVHKFDPTRGFKFISYAVWWIRQSILSGISEHGKLIKLPSNQVTRLNQIALMNERFEQKFGRRLADSEIADMLNIDQKHVTNLLVTDTRPASIDAPVDAEGTTLIEFIPNEDKPFDHDSALIDINTVLNGVLTPREVQIIKEVFGIECQSFGLWEIAEHLGLSRERVRQIYEHSIIKLKESKNIDILRKYL